MKNLKMTDWPCAARKINWAAVPNEFSFALVTVLECDNTMAAGLELCRTFSSAERARERWAQLPMQHDHRIAVTPRPKGETFDEAFGGPIFAM
jgi:hypothetical protein